MDVSKNRGGPPKWMVYNGNPIKMDDLGGFPIIFGNRKLEAWDLPRTFSIECGGDGLLKNRTEHLFIYLSYEHLAEIKLFVYPFQQKVVIKHSVNLCFFFFGRVVGQVSHTSSP